MDAHDPGAIMQLIGPVERGCFFLEVNRHRSAQQSKPKQPKVPKQTNVFFSTEFSHNPAPVQNLASRRICAPELQVALTFAGDSQAEHPSLRFNLLVCVLHFQYFFDLHCEGFFTIFVQRVCFVIQEFYGTE